MNKRNIKKALKRLIYLPLNKNFPRYLFNKIKHTYYRLTKSSKVAYPSSIMIELSNRCNLACTICPREYEYGKNMDQGLMELEQAKTIIDELHPYLDSIGLTGMGETFIYNDIEEIVDYIKQKSKGIIISISTNAVLTNFIEKVKRIINKIDTIQISIDGLDDIYNSIRIHSNFELLDKNIRELSKLCEDSSTDLMLNMVVTRENYKHMSDLVSYAEETRIRYLDLTKFNLACVTGLPVSYYKFYESEAFKTEFDKLNKAALEATQVYVSTNNFGAEKGFKTCHFPWSHFYFSQDGYVPPCCAKPFPKEKSFGSINNSKLIEVLNNDKFRDWRKMWFKNHTPKFCKKCHFID